MSSEDKSLPTIQNRIITAGVDIWQDSPWEIVYQHSLFCQIALPRSKPKGRVFERAYGNGMICIEAGRLYDGKKFIEQPLPAGPKPRLILIHVNSEAVKTKSRWIDMENSARQFMKRLGLNIDGGSSYMLFKREMMALAACRMTLGWHTDQQVATLNTQPIREFRAWVITDEDKPVFWPGHLELSKDYFDSLCEHAVPLDPRAVQALSHSALALDIYSFFARRLYTLKQPLKVNWHQFHEQFGQEYQGKNATDDFKKEFLSAIRAALTVYPSAKVEQVTGGLLLHPSVPPVHPASVAVSHGLANQVRQSLPAPAAPRSLRPATVERFRERYPRLDVYACKGDFDAWLAGKEQPPTHYDKAFLGFARRWAKGKG